MSNSNPKTLAYYLDLVRSKLEELELDLEVEKELVKAQANLIRDYNYYIDNLVAIYKDWKNGKYGITEMNDKLYDLSEKCFKTYG